MRENVDEEQYYKLDKRQPQMVTEYTVIYKCIQLSINEPFQCYNYSLAGHTYFFYVYDVYKARKTIYLNAWPWCALIHVVTFI